MPRFLFYAVGSIIHGQGKCKIRYHLEELVQNNSKVDNVNLNILKQPYSVAVVDGRSSNVIV